MLHEHVIFLEAALIEKHGQPLARGEAALLMLRLDARFAAADEPGGAGIRVLRSWWPMALFLKRGDGQRQLEAIRHCEERKRRSNPGGVDAGWIASLRSQ
jgi:hypothetical protein